MTQSNSQQVHAVTAQSPACRAARCRVDASMRTVALSLLVDRALSA